MKLPRKFYYQPTLKIAQALLGKFLFHQVGSQKVGGKIVETEAYLGQNDLASHVSRGRTKRNEIMFGPPGYTYIYLIYGMYYCLNVVTEKKDFPAAVLIRAIEPINQINTELVNKTNGPGKTCRYLKINEKLNRTDLTKNKLWIEDRGINIKRDQIIRAKRIGVDYAGKCKDYLWRFYIKDNKLVSKK